MLAALRAPRTLVRRQRLVLRAKLKTAPSNRLSKASSCAVVVMVLLLLKVLGLLPLRCRFVAAAAAAAAAHSRCR